MWASAAHRILNRLFTAMQHRLYRLPFPFDFEPDDLVLVPVDLVLVPDDLVSELLTVPDFPFVELLPDPPDFERTLPELFPLECEPEDFF